MFSLQDFNSVLVNGSCQIPDPLYKLIGSIVSFYIPLGVMILTYTLTVRHLAAKRQNLQTGITHSSNPSNFYVVAFGLCVIYQRPSTRLGDGVRSTRRIYETNVVRPAVCHVHVDVNKNQTKSWWSLRAARPRRELNIGALIRCSDGKLKQ